MFIQYHFKSWESVRLKQFCKEINTFIQPYFIHYVDQKWQQRHL